MRAILVIFCLFVGTAPCTAAALEAAERRLSVVFVGDTGTGGYKAGRIRSIATALEKITPWLQGDIVFGNLESVVTDRNDISARDKMFVFAMHPQGVLDLMRAGFNVFSTANNHALDFGSIGAGETLRHLEGFEAAGLLGWPGLGRDRTTALQPHSFSIKGIPVAISAFGIGGGGLPARGGRAGSLRGDTNFAALVNELENAPAGLRILSVHYGQEFVPFPTRSETQRLRHDAALPGGVSIVAGHHSHVARGAEISGDHLILYGLGNFLHFGTQNMGRFDICRDFGLLMKVGLLQRPDGALRIETVEAVPLTSMHLQTEPMSGAAAQLRLQVLNYLGQRLTNETDGAQGLRFALQENGSGLWCADGASDEGCVGWSQPALASGEVGRKIEAACGRDVRRGHL